MKRCNMCRVHACNSPDLPQHGPREAVRLDSGAAGADNCNDDELIDGAAWAYRQVFWNAGEVGAYVFVPQSLKNAERLERTFSGMLRSEANNV